jgi:hypothetical protein
MSTRHGIARLIVFQKFNDQFQTARAIHLFFFATENPSRKMDAATKIYMPVFITLLV